MSVLVLFKDGVEIGRTAGMPLFNCPDFVCDAIPEFNRLMTLGLDPEPVWQGSGFGMLGDFETWEIKREHSSIPFEGGAA